MSRSKSVLASGALLGAALFGAGLLLGLSIGRGERGGGAPAPAPGAAQATGGGVGARASFPPAPGGRTAGATAPRARGTPGAGPEPRAAGSPDDHGDSAEGEAHAHRPGPPPGSLDETLARILGSDGAADAAATAYAAALLRDRRSLDEALARFRSETDPAKLSALAFLLSHLKSPEIEALAVESAARGDRAHRIAGLEVLERFETPAALAPVVEILRAERDPGLLGAAIHALPEPHGASAADAAPVSRGLRDALSSNDPEVRRRAAIAYAGWGENAEATLAALLRDDPSPAVRAGAAFALELGRPRQDETRQALARAVARRDEDRLVRENAWRALGVAGALGADQAAIYRAFAEEMEGSSR